MSPLSIDVICPPAPGVVVSAPKFMLCKGKAFCTILKVPAKDVILIILPTGATSGKVTLIRPPLEVIYPVCGTNNVSVVMIFHVSVALFIIASMSIKF